MNHIVRKQIVDELKANMLQVLDLQLNGVPSTGNGYTLEKLNNEQLELVKTFVGSFY